jgi:GNAT superfamily N-acetyltransferase
MQPLDPSQYPHFAPLTYPMFRLWLEDPALLDRTVAVGYSFLGRPMALALGATPARSQEGQVLSLFVHPGCRRQGLGAALLDRLERELAARGVNRVRAVYTAQKPMTPVVEHLLAQAGWETPTPRMLVCRCTGEATVRLLAAPWMNPPPLPEGFEMFPWADLRTAEREALEAEQHTHPFVEKGLWPFFEGATFEPVSSLGLRYQGTVIGWMLNRREDASSICFDRLFVRQAFRKTGRAVVLLTESIKRQATLDPSHPARCGLWQVRADNAPMVRFVRRRLGPYLTSTTETYQTFKTLRTTSVNSIPPRRGAETPGYLYA